MRSNLVLFGAMLPMALVLAGCGVDSMQFVSTNMASPAVAGRAFGGQQPISGATIEVVAVGTTGYGSTGRVLGSGVTDSSGKFQFAPGAYTCPQADTPVYLLAIGGDPGIGTQNNTIVNAAGLGTCTAAQSSYVVVNEVTTAALAVSLSHFFTTDIGGVAGLSDWFGGPSTNANGVIQYARGLVLGDEDTIPALVNNSTGTAVTSTSTVTTESAKLYSIANTLASCVNSSGKTGASAPCGQLFRNTKNASGTAPTDTLQAAVQMALYPAQNVSTLYGLGTSNPPFLGLGGAPNDWTIGISYTASNLGLAVDTGTVSTLDIDANNNIWFPSNLSGSVGAAYFDQTSHTFNGPFNSTGMVHPQQVAIDQIGNVWLNDSGSAIVSDYVASSPTTAYPFSLANTTTTSVSVGFDGRINVGTTKGSTYGLGMISGNPSAYIARTGISFDYPVVSLASDVSAGNGVATTDFISTSLDDYFVSGTSATSEISTKKDDSGQVIYTGNDFVATRPYSAGSKNANDGLCIFSQNACFNIKGGTQSSPMGIAIDGGKSLWLADLGDDSVLQIPISTAGAAGGAVYLNNGRKVAYNEFLHDSADGGTLTAPYGIGIDAAGNVWVSNAGCNTTICTPSSFVLSEIVGAATPTITPVSSQIYNGTNLVGTEPAY
jgi:hypothetical protein